MLEGGGWLIHYILRPARLNNFILYFVILQLYLSMSVLCTINVLTKIVFKDYYQVINIRYLHIYITVANWQGRGVGHGIKPTLKYLWYPLFQAQWNRCGKQNHACFRLSAGRPV